MNFIKSVITGFVIAGILTIMAVGTIFTRLEGTNLDTEKLVFNVSPTILYDSQGNVLAKFFGDRRSTATYDEIPKEIIDAVIATEDRDFYTHSGFSMKSIGRAAVEIVKANGQLVQGGSTITQQLVKMTFLTSEKKLERKQQEVVYATLLEQKFSKKEIMEMYLNRIEYGNRAFGVKDAMMTYFGITFDQFKKLPKEERIIKASFLAGIPQAPSRFNPYRNPELTKQRRDIVIRNLKDTKVITENEYKNTFGKPLMVLSQPLRIFPEQQVKHKELVHLALLEASKRLDKDVRTIMNGGYKIYTSFDTNVYKIIRDEYQKNWNFPYSASDGVKVESSAVFLNPKNGEVIAFTGGRNIQEQLLDFNRAFMIKKQPGSSIKPLVAYGPALESGKFNSYSSLASDKGHVFPGNYVVKDHAGGRSSVTMKEALRQSLNIPAVWTLQNVGLKYAKEYTEKLGLDISKENTLGIALGGLQQGVSPYEMADAYQVFANKGIRTPAHSIREIKDGSNQIIFRMAISKTQTIKAENAAIMKEMLRNVVSNGTGKSAQVSGRQIAGKTGTNEHPLIKGSANSDVWFVGFDEELLGSVWMGFDKITKEHYLTSSSKASATLFSNLAGKILDYQAKKGKLKDPEKIGSKYLTPVDKITPVITLNGEAIIKLNLGDGYKELGAIATDNVDGDLTPKIKIEGKVKPEKTGDYTITYSVTDSAGNKGNVTRTVSIKDTKPASVSLVPVDTVPVPVPVEQSKPIEKKPIENPTDKPADKPSAIQKFITVKPNINKGVMDISWTLQDGDITYKLYKNGLFVGNITTNGYVDFDIAPGTNYEYYVEVIDNKTNQVLGATNKQSASIQ